MEFIYGSIDHPIRAESDGAITLLDSEREVFRCSLWEEDGVLRLYFNEPVVIVTAEDNVKVERMEETH
jgi:hypothetical protein